MTENFCDYVQSLTLKQLGFNEITIAKYTKDLDQDIFWLTGPEFSYDLTANKLKFGFEYNYNARLFEQEGTIAAPLKQECFKFFRDKFKLHTTITSISQESWQYHITAPRQRLGELFDEDFESYEQAENEAINKLITLCKKQE